MSGPRAFFGLGPPEAPGHLRAATQTGQPWLTRRLRQQRLEFAGAAPSAAASGDEPDRPPLRREPLLPQSELPWLEPEPPEAELRGAHRDHALRLEHRRELEEETRRAAQDSRALGLEGEAAALERIDAFTRSVIDQLGQRDDREAAAAEEERAEETEPQDQQEEEEEAPRPPRRLRKLSLATTRPKRRAKKHGSFGTYISRVRGLVAPGRSLGRRTVAVLDDLLRDTLGALADLGWQLARRSGRRTLKARDMQSAARLLLPGELARVGNDRAERALAVFRESGAS